MSKNVVTDRFCVVPKQQWANLVDTDEFELWCCQHQWDDKTCTLDVQSSLHESCLWYSLGTLGYVLLVEAFSFSVSSNLMKWASEKSPLKGNSLGPLILCMGSDIMAVFSESNAICGSSEQQSWSRFGNIIFQFKKNQETLWNIQAGSARCFVSRLFHWGNQFWHHLNSQKANYDICKLRHRAPWLKYRCAEHGSPPTNN